MRVEVLPDAEAVARRAAELLAAAAADAISARGRFALAVSGARTPQPAFRLLAAEPLPWAAVHLFQVDERVAPAGHAERNLTLLSESLLARAPLDASRIHLMPVEAPDLAEGAERYAAELEAVCGAPAVLDAVQLGLGDDGHTASLVPGDPVLEVIDADVAVTGPYAGRRRMTLTFPALDRARLLLWIVTGAGKIDALARLRRGDRSIPAGRVRRDDAILLADAAAAAGGGG